MKHGTWYSYNRKHCRCAECREKSKLLKRQIRSLQRKRSGNPIEYCPICNAVVIKGSLARHESQAHKLTLA